MGKPLVILLCLILTGCATAPKTEQTYAAPSIGNREVKELSDEEAVSLYGSIYSEPDGDKVDSAAKNITLTAFSNSLKINRPGLIDKMDVLKAAYTRVDFKSWKNGELEEEYVALSKRLYEEKLEKVGRQKPDHVDMDGKSYWAYDPSAGEGSGAREEIPTISIIRLTALFCLDKELEQRDAKAAVWRGARYTAVESAYVAAKIALIIASYMI